MAAQDTLDDMLDELRTRCPNLAPSVAPKAADDKYQRTHLAAIPNHPKDRVALAKALLDARAQRNLRCDLTHRAVDRPEDLSFAATWSIDAHSRTRKLQAARFVCADVALLLEPDALLERFASGRGGDDLAALAVLFCELNGHAAASPERALEWLQECCALALACRVVASALTGWVLVDEGGQPLSQQPIDALVTLARSLLSRSDGGAAEPSSVSKVGSAKKKRSVGVAAEPSSVSKVTGPAQKKKRRPPSCS